MQHTPPKPFLKSGPLTVLTGHVQSSHSNRVSPIKVLKNFCFLYLLSKRLLSRLEVSVFFVHLKTTEQDLSSEVLSAHQAEGSHWHSTWHLGEVSKVNKSSCGTALQWHLCPTFPLGNEARIAIRKAVQISPLLRHARRDIIEWHQEKTSLPPTELKTKSVLLT